MTLTPSTPADQYAIEKCLRSGASLNIDNLLRVWTMDGKYVADMINEEAGKND